MTASKARLRLCTCLLVANLAFIWGNSLLPGALSQLLSDWGRSVLGMSPSGASAGPDLLRKAAHFLEFACLGALLSWRMGMLGKRHRLAFPPAVAAAALDETIQIFSPNRGPGLKDVALDSCGAAVGILFVWIGYTYWKHTKHLEETNT